MRHRGTQNKPNCIVNPTKYTMYCIALFVEHHTYCTALNMNRVALNGQDVPRN